MPMPVLCLACAKKDCPAAAFWVLALLIFVLWPGQLLAQRPMGIDVSSYQGSTINWTNVKTAGITFAWSKATEGLTVNDSSFTSNETHGKNAGVLIGAYHFGHPELHADSAGADQEADHFWSIAKNYITNGGFYLMPALDVETLTNDAAYMSSWANEWCQRIVNYAGSNGVTIKPLIYISSGHAKTWYNSTVTNWGSWIAEWPSSPDPTNDVPSSTTPWSTWNAWQYANHDSIPGVPGTNYDADVFNGNTSNLFTTLVIDGSTHVPPSFTSQPSDRYADLGGSLTMRASATGLSAVSYQWQRNGSSISGATNATLTLTNIQTSNGGTYTVVATNLQGSITSDAVLTINPLYTSIFADNFDADSSSSWTVNHTADTRSIFAYDYSVVGVPSAPNSVGGTTKGLRMEANLTAGVTNALSASPNGQIFSGNYRLHFDMWINVNGPLPGGTGSTESLTAGVGTLGNRVQWNGNGTTADGVWLVVDGEGGVGDTSTTFGDFLAYVGTSQQAVSSGVYLAGTQTTARANADSYYANVFPAGQTAPAAQLTSFPSQTGSLPVGAVGMTWRDVIVSKGSSTVDWYIDGFKIASCPAASITASNIFVGYWDPFASKSDNTNMSFGLVDNLRVEVPVVAASIGTSPASLTVGQSTNATFTVIASGTPSPAYQWRYNGGPIANATNSAYTKTAAQPADAGSYSVIVTNLGGSVTSSSAILTVVVPPSITTPPQTQTTNQTSNVTFNVVAAGTAPLKYQWLKNGAAIGSATVSSYSLTSVTSSDAASYSVVVTNAAGSVTSSPAILTVIVPPLITVPPNNLTVNASSDAAFSVQATGTAPLLYQWLKNGTSISSATTTSYSLGNVTFGDAGSYSVVVTNAAGSVTSSSALLSVVNILFKNPHWAVDRSGFQFDITGAPGRNYKVEKSLETLTWLPLAVLTNETGTIQYKDTSAIFNALEVFYRVSAPK